MGIIVPVYNWEHLVSETSSIGFSDTQCTGKLQKDSGPSFGRVLPFPLTSVTYCSVAPFRPLTNLTGIKTLKHLIAHLTNIINSFLEIRNQDQWSSATYGSELLAQYFMFFFPRHPGHSYPTSGDNILLSPFLPPHSHAYSYMWQHWGSLIQVPVALGRRINRPSGLSVRH